MVLNNTVAVPHPTVLVALADEPLEGSLVQRLRARGFLVLEADDWEHVLHVVKTHSRPIQVMVTNGPIFTHAPMLKNYRPQLQILLINRPLDPDQVLMQVRQMFGSRTAAMPISKASDSRERTPEMQVLKMRA